jgi:DNA helicase-2/ATP-dependent DNA helicase PcrA
MPEASVPSRFLGEVPPQLIENLGSRSPAWSTPAYAASYGAGRRPSRSHDSGATHFNYEDESQELPRPYSPSRSASRGAGSGAGRAPGASPSSIDNIARFFGGKSGAGRPGSFARPAMNIRTPIGASGLRKGQRVMHAKYGEGTVLVREGDGEDAKLTVLFARHGIKKLMEKFANLRKL